MTIAPCTQMVASRGAMLQATLHAVQGPQRSAPGFVLLHGGPGLPMDYEPVVQMLAARFTVLAFDQRGTARSPVTDDRYTVAAYVDDIDALGGGAADESIRSDPW